MSHSQAELSKRSLVAHRLGILDGFHAEAIDLRGSKTKVEYYLFCRSLLIPSGEVGSQLFHKTPDKRLSRVRSIRYLNILFVLERSREASSNDWRDSSKRGRLFSSQKSFLFLLDAIYVRSPRWCCHSKLGDHM